MEAFSAVFLLAIVVEALIEVIKGWLPAGASVSRWVWPVVGALLGVTLCMLANVDLLHLAGIDLKLPPVGTVLTGLLISRGASFVHDIWARINSGVASAASDQSTRRRL